MKITKANLPAEKLQVESFSLTKGNMEISGSFRAENNEGNSTNYSQGAFYHINNSAKGRGRETPWTNECETVGFSASRSWTGSTSAASPYTTTMGSGTAITINPANITIKAWKRLT